MVMSPVRTSSARKRAISFFSDVKLELLTGSGEKDIVVPKVLKEGSLVSDA